MEPGELTGALAIGFAAGMASGLLGIGGGVLFVPGLVFFLDQGVLQAEATSLVAVVLVAAVGAARQRGYGNVRFRDGLLVAALAPPGVLLGVVVANEVPQRALELGFAGVQLYFAFELVRRVMAARQREPRGTG